jgi:hypothetical protein
MFAGTSRVRRQSRQSVMSGCDNDDVNARARCDKLRIRSRLRCGMKVREILGAFSNLIAAKNQ